MPLQATKKARRISDGLFYDLNGFRLEHITDAQCDVTPVERSGGIDIEARTDIQ